jgi:hypothetical protein
MQRTPKVITHSMLLNLGACEYYYAIFNQTFPKGMKVTKANLLKALLAGLPLNWGVNRFLTNRAKVRHRKLLEKVWERRRRDWDRLGDDDTDTYDSRLERMNLQHQRRLAAALFNAISPRKLSAT